MSSFKHGLLTEEEPERHREFGADHSGSGGSGKFCFVGAMTIGFVLAVFFNIAQSLTMRDLKASIAAMPTFPIVDILPVAPGSSSAIVSSNTIVLQLKRTVANYEWGSMRMYFGTDNSIKANLYDLNGTFVRAYVGTWSQVQAGGLGVSLTYNDVVLANLSRTWVFTTFHYPYSYAIVAQDTQAFLGVIYKTDILSGDQSALTSNYVPPDNYALSPLSSDQILSAVQEKTLKTRIFNSTNFFQVYFKSDKNLTVYSSASGMTVAGTWGLTTDTSGNSAQWVQTPLFNETRNWYSANGGLFRANVNGTFLGFTYFLEESAGNTL